MLETPLNSLYSEIKTLIDDAKTGVSVQINATITLLYWKIGYRIRTEILKEERAEYGKEVIKKLGEHLTYEYGTGFSRSNLLNFIKFAEKFPDFAIVQTLSGQLTWSHITILLYLKEDLQRFFYIEMCCLEKWTVRTLKSKIDGMLFERTALSKKPEELIKRELSELRLTGSISNDIVFKDPYILDFLGLKNTYSEKDLENAILVDIAQFLSELGTDFTFIARQKRIVIDGEDYKMDLLFYHRGLKCLIVIDLKLGKFKASYKGQMELYLRWLEKYDKKEGENRPIGLILCADKSDEHIELLMLDNSNIRVAQYLTELPSKEILKNKLHRAIEEARKKSFNIDEFNQQAIE